MARQLDDAILTLRTNELELGTWILKTEGDPAAVLAADRALLAHQEHWFVRETIGMPSETRTFTSASVTGACDLLSASEMLTW